MSASINAAMQERFRCPEGYLDFGLRGALSEQAKFFRFGDAACYGRRWLGSSPDGQNSSAYEASTEVRFSGSQCQLPFDPTEVADNLRRERFLSANGTGGAPQGLVRRTYYFLRPLLPVGLRTYAQRLALRGWARRPFPSWPVDRSVDLLLGRLLQLTIEARRLEPVPFIWFWPEGKSGCAIMTHDVETSSGLARCDALMDVDDSFGIKASFQIVPGGRYRVTDSVLQNVRKRGFEVNIHDWNHDGHLFRDRETFLQRVAKINESGRKWEAEGFRSAILYRNSGWYDALDFAYDMSIPNVGHLDPQPGGCCTVMPYFIGEILEVPVTATQDYSLFHILNDYSIDLWKRQIEIILAGNGMASFIVHPDYIHKGPSLDTYKALLNHLDRVRFERNVWVPRPCEVNRWWRERSQMRLVCRGGEWKIEGSGSGRARIAYAQIEDGRLVYSFGAPGPALTAEDSRLSLRA